MNALFDGSEVLYAFFSVNGSGAFQGYARVQCGIGRELTDTEWLKADGASTWGEVFRVDWVAKNPLPFAAIPASITNSLNEHKHVKIGFDGTELGAAEGETLRQLFHRPQQQFQQQRQLKKEPRGASKWKQEPASAPAPSRSPPASFSAPMAKQKLSASSSFDGQPRAPERVHLPVPVTQLQEFTATQHADDEIDEHEL